MVTHVKRAPASNGVMLFHSTCPYCILTGAGPEWIVKANILILPSGTLVALSNNRVHTLDKPFKLMQCHHVEKCQIV